MKCRTFSGRFCGRTKLGFRVHIHLISGLRDARCAQIRLPRLEGHSLAEIAQRVRVSCHQSARGDRILFVRDPLGGATARPQHQDRRDRDPGIEINFTESVEMLMESSGSKRNRRVEAAAKILNFPATSIANCFAAIAVLKCAMPFQLASDYQPQGDQAQAIAKLTKSIEAGNRHQTLLGVTGSGKTFTAANVMRNIGKPTLVISHNKTLAAQLYSEFKQFFPNNAVEYFVSYFDYYQPEAYIPRTDTYIEKDSSINEEIERLRLSTTSSLLSRRDVIVISSVSCIYGLGSPEDYMNMLLTLKLGQPITREAVLAKLVDMLYERNDIAFERGRFRVRGDVVEVQPANLDDEAIRIEFFGDEIDRITRFDPLTGRAHEQLTMVTLYPGQTVRDAV